MAAFGARATGTAAGDVTQLDTGNLNVTGSDLAIVAAIGESSGSGSPAWSFTWDPAGNNEAFTGSVADISAGTYIDLEMEYLDDPTAANAPVRASGLGGASEHVLIASFFTAAADIVAGDSATDSFATTGTSLSATPGNVVSGDLVYDQLHVGQQLALAAGANQTETGADVDAGYYSRANSSYQDGANGGVMSWTTGSQNYGAILIAVRIPDSGGGGGGPTPGPNLMTLLGVG